ncbi:hypothetical protein CFP56_030444 [Quercus suber]|uniref:Uncharacterized protein n=1 Tax=Quercus suber TaxID=58331 RepID=A0AAW0JPW1_QUESU
MQTGSANSREMFSRKIVSPIQKVYPTVTQMAPPSLNNQENAEKNIALFFLRISWTSVLLDLHPISL